jgi:hypothetical protein
MSKTISGTFEPKKPPKGWKKFYGNFVMESNGTIFLPWIMTGCSAMEVAKYLAHGQFSQVLKRPLRQCPT